MHPRIFFSLLLVANSLASPVVLRDSPATLPLTRHYNFSKGVTVADNDRARIQLLHNRRQTNVEEASVWPISETNAVVTYTNIGKFTSYVTPVAKTRVQVGIGSPPTFSTPFATCTSSDRSSCIHQSTNL